MLRKITTLVTLLMFCILLSVDAEVSGQWSAQNGGRIGLQSCDAAGNPYCNTIVDFYYTGSMEVNRIYNECQQIALYCDQTPSAAVR